MKLFEKMTENEIVSNPISFEDKLNVLKVHFRAELYFLM